MENVPQILDSPEYAEFLELVEASGMYRIDARVLNVANFGVAQRRMRAFVIGTELDSFPWPKQTHADPALKDDRYLPWRTFGEAVAGLSLEPDGKSWHRKRNPKPM